MNYLLLTAIFLWLCLILHCARLCYRALRYRDYGSPQNWAIVLALALGALWAVQRAAVFIIQKTN